jgi:transcriptional regulator GlxA family with amidase domain
MKLSLTLLLLSLLVPAPERGASPRAQEAATGEAFVCPPCGAACHFTSSPKPGNCGVCGMGLVPLGTIPQVGVLLHPDAGLSSLTILSVFSGSNAVRAFTVADTAEPMRLDDALEVRPQFAFGEAPALDVLVVPEGFGAWDDPMLVEWVAAVAAKARFVLSVGAGSVVLARAGLLKGETVPGQRFLVERGKELAPELVFAAEPALRRVGKFVLARDTQAALEGSLDIVGELAGAERAQRTAAQLGLVWSPETKPEAK